MSDYYTAKEIQDKFNIKKSTLYAMIKRGDIVVVRVGKTSIRIPKDLFDKSLEG